MTEEEKVGTDDKPKLGIRVLISVIIGIIFIFLLMSVINTFFFKYFPEGNTAYYFSIMASNILFVLLILIIKKDNKLTLADLGWKRLKFSTGLKSVLKVWGITWVINIIYLVIVFFKEVPAPENELSRLLQDPTFLFFVINALIIAVAAPFIEETLFRGLLFGSMRTYCGVWTAVVLSAAIFSALHLDMLGFIPRFALGIGLGYLYVKHNSIYPSIGMHALNNLLALIIVSLA